MIRAIGATDNEFLSEIGYRVNETNVASVSLVCEGKNYEIREGEISFKNGFIVLDDGKGGISSLKSSFISSYKFHYIGNPVYYEDLLDEFERDLEMVAKRAPTIPKAMLESVPSESEKRDLIVQFISEKEGIGTDTNEWDSHDLYTLENMMAHKTYGQINDAMKVWLWDLDYEPSMVSERYRDEIIQGITTAEDFNWLNDPIKVYWTGFSKAVREFIDVKIIDADWDFEFEDNRDSIETDFFDEGYDVYDNYDEEGNYIPNKDCVALSDSGLDEDEFIHLNKINRVYKDNNANYVFIVTNQTTSDYDNLFLIHYISLDKYNRDWKPMLEGE